MLAAEQMALYALGHCNLWSFSLFLLWQISTHLRGGVGPCTRRKGLGGARRPGIFEYVCTDQTSVIVRIKPHRQESAGSMTVSRY